MENIVNLTRELWMMDALTIHNFKKMKLHVWDPYVKQETKFQSMESVRSAHPTLKKHQISLIVREQPVMEDRI